MKVIFHPTYRMNIDVQLSTNARNVSPQFGAEFVVYGFVSGFGTEHDVDYVLCVGMGHVPHLRCSASYIPRTQRLRAGLKYVAPPALERNANAPFSSQRLRAGLNRDTPTALEETQMLPSPPSAYALG